MISFSMNRIKEEKDEEDDATHHNIYTAGSNKELTTNIVKEKKVINHVSSMNKRMSVR